MTLYCPLPLVTTVFFVPCSETRTRDVIGHLIISPFPPGLSLGLFARHNMFYSSVLSNVFVNEIYKVKEGFTTVSCEKRYHFDQEPKGNIKIFEDPFFCSFF